MHPLTHSIVRILNERNQVIGAGFLVPERHVITCAHVIISASGVPPNIQSISDQQVHLDFVAVPRALLMARVTHWYSMDKEDIAVLELEGDPPDGTQPARLVISNNFWGHKFQAFGFPMGFDDGIWSSGELQEVVESAGLVQMESSREGAFVGGGFGGAPVWDMQLSGVIGMCYSHESRPTSKLAFMKPISSVVEVWPELNKYVVQADKPSEDSTAC